MTTEKKDAAKKAVDKRNFEAAQSDSKETFRSATAYNPGFQKFTHETGAKHKPKIVVESTASKAKINTGKDAHDAEKFAVRYEKNKNKKDSPPRRYKQKRHA